MKLVPIYPPEIEDLNGQKTISYFVGKSESLTPAMDWLIQAKEFINYYNALPKEKRGKLYAKKYPTQNDCFMVDCEADEYANGYEVWIEVVPISQSDEPFESDDDNKSDLTIVAREYDHEGGPVTDYYEIPMTSIISENEYSYLKHLTTKQA